MVTLPFIDAHFHPLQLSYFTYGIDLAGVNGEEELFKKFDRNMELDNVLGFHFVEFPGFLGRDSLNKFSKDIPVVVVRTCLHKLWMNDKAVEVYGRELSINDDGSVVEEDVWIVIDRFFKSLGKGREELISNMFLALLGKGIVGGIEMGIDVEDGKLMSNIADEVGFEYFYFVKSDYDPISCLGSTRCLGVKLFADGSLGARTAALIEDYADSPGEKGILNWKDEELYDIMKLWHEAGYDISVHAIGDRALSQVLRIYRTLLSEFPRPHRHRVEHLQVMYPGAAEAMKAMTIYASIQPTFTPEIPWAIERLGKERMAYAYRWRELIENIPTLIGTDAPVYTYEPIDVLNGLTNDIYWLRFNLEPSSVSFGKAIDIYTVTNMRYLGLITDTDLYRVEWLEFPYRVEKVVSRGRVVYQQ